MRLRLVTEIERLHPLFGFLKHSKKASRNKQHTLFKTIVLVAKPSERYIGKRQRIWRVSAAQTRGSHGIKLYRLRISRRVKRRHSLAIAFEFRGLFKNVSTSASLLPHHYALMFLFLTRCPTAVISLLTADYLLPDTFTFTSFYAASAMY